LREDCAADLERDPGTPATYSIHLPNIAHLFLNPIMAPTRKSHRKAIKQAVKKQKARKRNEYNKRRAKEAQMKLKALKETANCPANIGSLPTEIIDRILGHFDSPEVVTVALACPTVYRVLRARHGRLQNVLSPLDLPRTSSHGSSCSLCRTNGSKTWDYIATTKTGCMILCQRENSYRSVTSYGHTIRWVRIDAMLAALQQYTTRRLGDNYFHTKCQCREKLEERVAAYNTLLGALPTNRRMALRKDLTKAERQALVANRNARRAELQLNRQKCSLALSLIEGFQHEEDLEKERREREKEANRRKELVKMRQLEKMVQGESTPDIEA
jgi:hypothetical protein